jgi:hypothetical protein
LLDKEFADFSPKPEELDFKMLDAFEDTGLGSKMSGNSDQTSKSELSRSLWSRSAL